MDSRVAKVLAIIKEEFRGETSLADLALVVNLSPSRLRFLFKSEVGMPPAQYRRAFRMERAKELLENTFMTVKEIRISIGVSDQSHFIREFKKTYGLAPARYRMQRATLRARRTLEGLMIMLVDDDRKTRERIGSMLEQAGACVTTMDSARKALAALERMRPHILIIDIGLRNEDGYKLIRTARAIFEERGEQIPAVALANDPASHDEETVISAGFQIHLPKPQGSGELVDVVAKLTGRMDLSPLGAAVESANK